MNLIQFLGSIELGLVFGLLAIGVFISFRILDFPDLTADGSFPLGAAVSASLIVAGVNPWLSTFIAIISGCLAGLFTAWLNVKWNILNLLAGILTMTALYSINLRIMGSPNIGLSDVTTVFSFLEAYGFSSMNANIILLSIFVILMIGLLYRFLNSEMGLAIRATGVNLRMAKAHGVHTNAKILIGMAISNGFIALAGALYAQSQGMADITLGSGTIITGLAAVIIGEAIFHTRNLLLIIVACIIGAISHKLALAFALNASFLGLRASDVQLVNAVIVGIAMIFSQARFKIMGMMSRRAS